MGQNEANVLNTVAGRTDSGLILFFVLVAVLMVVLIIPLYSMITKDRRERREAEIKREKDEVEAANTRQDKYMEREKHIIEVVTANTEVMASLKGTLERDGKDTKGLRRAHYRRRPQRAGDHAHGHHSAKKGPCRLAGQACKDSRPLRDIIRAAPVI